MNNKFIRIICYLLASFVFLLGLAVFAYPLANRSLINHNIEKRLEGFVRVREESIDTDVEKGEFSQLYADMQAYNEKIFTEGQKGLTDAWSYEQSGFNLTEYGVYNDIVAQIRIPKMDTILPVYMGATNANMAQGAAQLGQTSAPIGGVNTNCVLAAHRGAAGGEFFLYIENLSVGDEVYIDNLWETLTYRVVDIEVINPDEISKVLIRENQDMLTLLTCHPYPTNRQRYVVYCQRSEETKSGADATQENTQSTVESSKNTESLVIAPLEKAENSSSFFINFELALYVIISAFLVLLAVFLFVPFKMSKNQKHKK